MFSLKLIWSPKRMFLQVFAVLLSPCAQAGSVTAELTIDGKAFKPAQVAAFHVRQPSNPRTFVTYVVLTATPVNADKVKNSVNPMMSLDQDPAVLGDHLGVYILRDGTIEVAAHVDGDAYDGDAYPIGSPGVPGELTATCKVNTTTHVACQVKAKQPVKTREGRTCTLDLVFDTEVLARSGKPLAKDGGEPGKAFLALYSAAHGDDLGKILALLLPTELANRYKASYVLDLPLGHDSPEVDIKRIKAGLENWLPKAPKIIGGEQIAEDYALLEVEVENKQEHTLDLVELRRLDGTWRYVNATLVGMLK